MLKQQATNPVAEQNLPWYRQFWPWFIIALLASSVVASFVSLWLAISHPDPLVVSDDEYRRVKNELKAQVPEQEEKEDPTGKSEPNPN